MTEFDLLIALHIDAARQGPGGDAETREAIRLARLPSGRRLEIADIGCGTGAVARCLAQTLDARITAVDLLPPFLDKLRAEAQAAGLGDRIETVAASMDDLPFAAGVFDAIWSEGAVYNIGFAKGVAAWRPFLADGGVLAVSEITWTTADRPAELQAHWTREYSEIDTASAKLAVLEAQGYSPIGYFVLPERCWLDTYYRPMQARFAAFLDAHDHIQAARAIVEAETHEIALYERYRSFFSYGYYVARKVGA